MRNALFSALHPVRQFRPEGGTGAAAAVADPLAAPAETTSTAKWYEDQRFNEAHRTALTAKGLTTDDPLEAMTKVLDMQINAERKLGQPADQLLARPKKDQDVAAWMRENAALFGIPDAPDKYEVKPPESWPKDAKWDGTLEAEARKIAHEEGLSGRALQRFVDTYAGAISRLTDNATADLATARTQMITDLQKDWGNEMEARIARAQSAASVVGEKLGLNQEGILSLVQTLSPKTGDANVLKLFDLVGDMISNDTAIGLGKGSGALGMTASEAQNQLAALRSPDGAYGKAVATQNYAEISRLKPEVERLSKIAAGS